MNIEIIGRNDIDDVRGCFLENRGIKDVKKYTRLTESVVNDFNDLDNIDKAVKCYLRFVQDVPKEFGHALSILVDCDCDGFTSAAILYNYTKQLNPELKIHYLLHTGKQHGLSDDITIPDDTGLLIIPDAGSNDVEQCKLIFEMLCPIIILDHHQYDVQNHYAIVVNNQSSDNYSNKELCGAGVVYQFLRAVDEELWTENADNYLDLVALGNIADVMDMRSYETKYLVEKGLKQIINSAFEAFVSAKSWDIGGNLNINSVAWNIAPMINALCRVGTQEEKEILFKALIGDESDEYEYRHKDPETNKFIKDYEDVYAHAARVAGNAKARQDKIVRKVFSQVCDWIEEHDAQDDAIIFARYPDSGNTELTGLIAIRVANKYRKPTLIIHQNMDDEGMVYWSGSGRNFDNSPIDSFKELLDKSGLFEYVAGHDNAFGLKIKGENVKAAIEYCNDVCKDIDFSTYKCDFGLDYENDLDLLFIRDVDNLKNYIGAGLKEPLVFLSDVILKRDEGEICGKEMSTWRFTVPDHDDIVIIKFLNKPNDKVLKWLEDDSGSDEMIINVVCKVAFNEFNKIVTPQVQVIDYDVIECR